MGTRLELTLSTLAAQIAACLPSRWDPTVGEIQTGTPELPDDAVALTWAVGDWLLGVAVDGPSAELLTAQEQKVDLALAEPVAAVATILNDLVEGGGLEIGPGTVVDDLPSALQGASGESYWVAIHDGEDHRASVVVRLVITAFMEGEAGSSPAPTPDPAPSQPASGGQSGTPVAVQGSIGQQAGARIGMASSPRDDQFTSPLVAGVNPNDMPSSLGRTPGDAPMMPPNAIAHPAEFTAFDDYGQLGGTPHPMALLNDVELGVTAELGRTRLTVKDVLGLTPGSIIELDRSAGAPVDVVVNGTLIARGEVVVIDEEFGIRITQIMGMPDLAKANAMELANEG